MSYTNIDLVKFHVNVDGRPAGYKRNYSLVLSGSGWIDLSGSAIVDNSVTVKTIKNKAPEFYEISLADSPVIH